MEYLDAARLEAWRGPRPFSMRQKLELIRAAAVSAPAPIVQLDADVLAHKPLDAFASRLGTGELVMHRQEHRLARAPRPRHRQLRAALKALPARPGVGR